MAGVEILVKKSKSPTCLPRCGDILYLRTTIRAKGSILANVFFQTVQVEVVVAVSLSQHVEGYILNANGAFSAVGDKAFAQKGHDVHGALLKTLKMFR